MINNCNISQKEFGNRKISTKISEQSKLTDECDTHSFVSDQVKKYKIIRCETYMPTNQTSSQEIDEDDLVDILKTRFAKGEREK
jgi:hypothetical protein